MRKKDNVKTRKLKIDKYIMNIERVTKLIILKLNKM